MITSAIIFGGSGYIGKNLLRHFVENNTFQQIYVYDIAALKGFDNEKANGKVLFEFVDVREPIEKKLRTPDSSSSWVFNFAAVHREPGHKYREYFDTNIPGAKNIVDFANSNNIDNILFTSSIAPYGKSLYERTEKSEIYPETAYGISKALAEGIHKEWLAGHDKRRLIIVRPSVIFGPKDPGNVYRMIKSLKKGTFVLPNGGNIIKGYGYIYGLIESMVFVMNKKERFIIYNYAENPLEPLCGMVKIAKKELGYTKPTLKLSVKLLAIIAFFVQKGYRLVGKKSDIHPVRVRKAGFPTNIKPQYLIDKGFEFKYDFENALRHWRMVSPEDFE